MTVVGTCGADAGAVVDESAEKDAGPRTWGPGTRTLGGGVADQLLNFHNTVNERFQRATYHQTHSKQVVFSALRECRKIELPPIQFSLESLAGRGMDCLWRCVMQRLLEDARKKQVWVWRRAR